MTVTTATTALDQWVQLRGQQQDLEKQAKALKKQADALSGEAQEIALAELAAVNELDAAEPDAYPLLLSQAKTKTFQFNPLFKVQVSFTKKLAEDEKLVSLRDSLKAEQESIAKANKPEIDVLLAEKVLIESKLAALQTSPVIEQLTEEVGALTDQLTVPVVKSLALKAA